MGAAIAPRRMVSFEYFPPWETALSILFTSPKFRAVDITNTPIPGSFLSFYATGTSTLQPIYADDSLLTPLANPLQSDTNGLFPAIYLDTSLPQYKVVQQSPSVSDSTVPGSLSGIGSVDPYNPAFISGYPQTAIEIANSSVVNAGAPYGSFSRYGILPTNKADAPNDNGARINKALLSNSIVYDDYPGMDGLYEFKTTIQFKFAGQILKGRGFGDSNAVQPLNPRSVLKYTGSAGGIAATVYLPGTGNLSEVQMQDFYIDGNNLLNRGIEGYNDAVSTGSWRNQWRNLNVANVTSTNTSVTGSANPTGLYLGAGTVVANANDVTLENVYTINCNYGVVGSGATIALKRVSIQGCSVMGLTLGPGAMCTTSQCIFSTNAQDLSFNGIQQYTDFGSWFENSTNGILKPIGAHSTAFFGSLLHTSSASVLIDWNNQAGPGSLVGCFVPGTTGSFAVKNHNATYDYNYHGTDVVPDFGYKQRVQQSGGLVRVDNAGFLVALTSSQTNVTGDGTAAPLNASPVTKSFDLASAVGASTGIFTAPATGYYEFDLRIGLSSLGAGHNDVTMQLVVAGTSAQSYECGFRCHPGAVRNTANDIFVEGRVTAPMTAGDTAYMSIAVGGSTKTVGILAAGQLGTRFQGKMA